MITKAQLPPRKGYVERINPSTGEHYYHKVYTKVGTVHRNICITKSQEFRFTKHTTLAKVTIIGGGGSKSSGADGGAAETAIKFINISNAKPIYINIGKAGSNGLSGEPTSFGDLLAAMGGIAGASTASISKPITIDGITYGIGETDNGPATNGVCIIEYDEVIYE